MKTPNVKCEQCGVEFYRHSSQIAKHTFCSRGCRGEYSKARPNVKCDQCGEAFVKKPSDIKKVKHNFCSNKCKILFRFRKTRPNTPCDQCGVGFYMSPYRRKQQRPHHFCSNKCQGEHQTVKINLICDECGVSFAKRKGVSIKSAEQVSHFCSKQCQYKYKSKAEKIKRKTRLATRGEVLALTRQCLSLTNLTKGVEQCRI